MKKSFIMVTLLFVLTALTVSQPGSGRRNVSVIGSVGTAVSDFEGAFFDVGVEIRTVGNFYLQFLYDYYLNPTGVNVDGVNSSAYGFNLFAVYKFKLSKKLNLFTKVGANYTTVKASVSSPRVSASNSDFGAGTGAGFEFNLNKNTGILLGGTAKTIISESGAGIWFKIYCGISFRLR